MRLKFAVLSVMFAAISVMATTGSVASAPPPLKFGLDIVSPLANEKYANQATPQFKATCQLEGQEYCWVWLEVRGTNANNDYVFYDSQICPTGGPVTITFNACPAMPAGTYTVWMWGQVEGYDGTVSKMVIVNN